MTDRGTPDELRWFRAVVIAGEAATVLVTWPLWGSRALPPNLPLAPMPQLEMGWIVLASLLLCVGGSLRAVVVHGLVLGVASCMDQMRLQPQMLSFFLLLVGSLPREAARTIGRAHLATLWLWAGIHKLCSPGYAQTTLPWLAFRAGLQDHLATVVAVGFVLAGLEVALGALVLLPAARRAVAWGAWALHLAAFVALSPLGAAWNPSVWGWNLTLATAGFALIAPWPATPRTAWSALTGATRALVLLLAVTPAGHFVSAVEPAFTWSLYAGNKPRAFVVDADGRRIELNDALGTWRALRVPVPAAPRLLREAFEAAGSPGARLEIVDPRFPARSGRAGMNPQDDSSGARRARDGAS